MSQFATENNSSKLGRISDKKDSMEGWHLPFFDVVLLLVIVFGVIAVILQGIGIPGIPLEPQFPKLPQTESGIDDPVRRLIVRFVGRGTPRRAYLFDNVILTVDSLDISKEKLKAGDVTEYNRLRESGLRGLNETSPEGPPCVRALAAIADNYGTFKRDQFIMQGREFELSDSFLDKIEMSINDLRGEQREIRVHVRADTACAYGFIVDIFNLCDRSEFHDLYFDVNVMKR